MPLFCESVVARGIFQRVFLVFAMVHTLFSMAADLKSVEVQASRGSNPLSSAILVIARVVKVGQKNLDNPFFVHFKRESVVVRNTLFMIANKDMKAHLFKTCKNCSFF